MFKDKKVLVTGGTGLVGRELSLLLLSRGAQVRVASLDENNLKEYPIEVYKTDLRNLTNCKEMCKDMNYIFHVAGIKGSPVLVKAQPYIFFRDFLQLNTNMIAAMNECPTMIWGTYVSTVGTYGEADIFTESELWTRMPSKNDWYAGWAKRMGELQIDGYEQQYNKRNISIIKPVNIYGSYDNFDLRTSTMVPSFVRKIAEATDSIEIWGDGSTMRDIIHARDVAKALVFAVENRIKEPINVGNGKGICIKEVLETLIKISGKTIKINHDMTKPTGDKFRIADICRLVSYGFQSTVSLEEGLKETYNWYLEHKGEEVNRFNPFDII
jgi:GDP-L-fucose synthase